MGRSILCLLICFIHANFAHAQATDVTIAWDAPSLNSDGTQLDNLDGFNIYYGTQSGAYEHVVDVGNVTTGTVTGVDPTLNHYFSVTAYSDTQVESDYNPDYRP